MLVARPTQVRLNVHTASSPSSITPIRTLVRWSFEGEKFNHFAVGDEEAAGKFAEIARAYEVLSDDTKR